ncbi:MAG TPA: DUF2277 domain-containing protein [Candidatus Nitrosocosmicus sp.]|nr:DUF2277 domain-containing protein [Candidatus Nitrosocosmicus sp.]
MCRNIKILFNFDPPATDEEIRYASLQFIRKISGFKQPSKTNERAFNQAVEKVVDTTKALFNSLSTNANPRNREVESQRERITSLKRFNNKK